MLVSESIYYTKDLGYIDLSKVVEVSNAYFIDCMDSGGFCVGFQITYQLVEKVKIVKRKVDYELHRLVDGGHQWEIMSEKYGWVRQIDYKDGQEKLCVVLLQEEVDELVNAWITYKGDTKCQS